MDEKDKGPCWQIIGKSVRGASHVRKGLPNQDAICWWPKGQRGKRVVLSVSDGHGSNECFRSRIGAHVAAKVAETISKSLLLKELTSLDISTHKSWAEENLPKEIARQWRNVVADAISKKPFTREEWKTLEMKRGTDARRRVVTNPIVAYGATILTVLVTEFFIVFLQLGDGDILVVFENGEVMRPMPKDERLFANETTSLCLRDSWGDFGVVFQRIDNSVPALILVSTDGYSNSFVDDKEFLKIGPDILDRLRMGGLDKVNESLESWLVDASRQGSGDDITLGIICRMDVLRINENSLDTEQTTSKDPGVPDNPGDLNPFSGAFADKSIE
ncbi:MAG: PP2C family serine/threonine-protein phosphatase [Thermodesulfobacteriota bacterium]